MVRKTALIIGAIGVFLPQSLSAQGWLNKEERFSITPSVNVENIASVGSTIIEKKKFYVVRAPAAERLIFKHLPLKDIEIKPGEPLNLVTSKAKVKACNIIEVCAYDDDGSGMFTRAGPTALSRTFALPIPVPYSVRDVVIPSKDDFDKRTIFLGATGDAIRFSYREFADDMARPAFTEELSFPLPKIFPAPIVFKDVHLTVLGVDGRGLRYRIDSVASED